MRRSIAQLIFMALAVLGGSAPAQAVPDFPPYIIGLGREVALYTNGQWFDFANGEGGPATETKVYTSSTKGEDPPSWVWKKRCRAGKQTLRLKRTIELTGTPNRLRVEVRNALKVGKFDLFFNDTRVLHVDDLDTASFSDLTLDAADLGALHAGLNTIVAVFKKKALGTCDAGAGVFLGLEGTFQTDLRVGKRRDTAYRHGKSALVKIRLQNLGPSIAYSPVFTFQLGGIGGTLPDGRFEYDIDGALMQGIGSDALCEVKHPNLPPNPPPHFGFAQVICPIDTMEIGTDGQVLVRILHNVSEPFDHDSMSFFWRLRESIDAAPDPNLSNSGANGEVVFCSETSTLEECKKPEN